MPAKLDVVNQALNELGFPAVQALTSTAASTLISNKLDILLPELLLRTDWNFAIKFVTNNTPNTVNISPDYLYNYALPPDYNRMDRFSWQLSTTAFGFVYRIIDQTLMTNVRPVLYYYVTANVDYSVITPLFYRALVLYVAAESAAVLTNNIGLAKILEGKYQQKMNEAIIENDQDRMIQSTPMNYYDRQSYI